MVDLVALLADRGCLHIIFRILAHLDSWDLQVLISIIFITKTKQSMAETAYNPIAKLHIKHVDQFLV